MEFHYFTLSYITLFAIWKIVFSENIKGLFTGQDDLTGLVEMSLMFKKGKGVKEEKIFLEMRLHNF